MVTSLHRPERWNDIEKWNRRRYDANPQENACRERACSQYELAKRLAVLIKLNLACPLFILPQMYRSSPKNPRPKMGKLVDLNRRNIRDRIDREIVGLK